ncbi:hypothetical protein ACWF90_26550, partial [Streptomyces sp. NPDC054946]
MPALTVEPALYRIGAAELAALDAAVPPSAVIKMPPRDPARIPQPPAPAPPPAPRTRRRAGTPSGVP